MRGVSLPAFLGIISGLVVDDEKEAHTVPFWHPLAMGLILDLEQTNSTVNLTALLAGEVDLR